MSRERLVHQWYDDIAELFDGAHDVPVFHAHPLNARDEPIATCRLHQIDNIFGTLFRCANDEPIGK
jgi:hypothetical protein